MKWLRFALLAILVGALVFLAVEAALLLRAAREALGPLGAQGVDVMAKLGTFADKGIAFEDQQGVYAKKLDRGIAKTVADIHDITIHTDISLNRELMPRLIDTVKAANDATAQISAAANSLQGIGPTAQDAIEQAAQDLHATAGKGQAMIEAATDDLRNPRITEATDKMAEAAGNLDGMTADGKKITADAAAFVHRELAPVKGIWNTIKYILKDFAEPLAAAATAIK